MRKKPTKHNKSNPKRFKKKPSKKDASAPIRTIKPTEQDQDKDQEMPLESSGMRLNKYLAHAGICSRRKAAEHIKNGLVSVNGQLVIEIGHRVQQGDTVLFQEKEIHPIQDKVYLLLNKPKNVITTLKDENQRRTVIDFI